MEKEDGQCPERFVIFSPYGRFNNIMLMLVHTLLLSSRMERTALLVDEYLENYKFEELLWFSDEVCVRVVTPEFVNQLIKDNDRPVKTIAWNDDICSQELKGADEQEFIKLSENHFRKYDWTPNVGCIRDSMPVYDDKLVFLPCPYYINVDKKSYMNALKHVRIHPDIAKIGDQFIRDKFDGKPFVAAHMRSFEGTCDGDMRHVFDREDRLKPFLQEAIDSCSMTWEYISGHLKKYAGIDADNVPIYLASDDQQMQNVVKLREHQNLWMLTGHGLPEKKETAPNTFDYMMMEMFADFKVEEPYRSVNKDMLDMYILTKSEYFLGNPYSSYSFHVVLWREIDGHSPDTNIQPAYKEEGLLHHLYPLE